MKNQSNESPLSILKSDNKGNKPASLNADNYSFNGNSITAYNHSPVTLSLSFLQAAYARNLEREYFRKAGIKQETIERVLTANEHGYFTELHTTVDNDPTDNPLAPAGKVISAEQYQLGYIRAGFTTDNSHTIQGILSNFRAITDKTSKGELTKMLAAFSELFESTENHDNYAIIAANEARDAEKLEQLTALGLINISRLKSDSDKSAFSGRVALADASILVQSLPKAGYTILNSETDMTTFELVISIEES